MTRRPTQDAHRQRILECLVKAGRPTRAAAVGRRVGRTPAQVSSLCRSLRGRGLIVAEPGPGGLILWAPTTQGQEQGLQGLLGRARVSAWLCSCGAQVWTNTRPPRCPSCGASSSTKNQPWARPLLVEVNP
jgi:hypothetical protein